MQNLGSSHRPLSLAARPHYPVVMGTTRQCIGAGIALLLAAVARAEPVMENIDLWEADKGGYLMYRIPALVATPKGTLLAWCEARKTAGDWAHIDILFRRSTDGGRSWSESRRFVEPPENVEKNPVAFERGGGKAGEITTNNPCAIVDHESGVVHFLYCVEYARCFYIRSDDDGVTWSKPVEITDTFAAFSEQYRWRVLATGPGHGLKLTHGPHRGRLLVPVWLSVGTAGNGHRPNRIASIYSDDQGKTWKAGQIIAMLDGTDSMNETEGVQLADGRVMFSIRNYHPRRRRAVAYSVDGATNWSAPAFDEGLFDPICMASIVRYDDKRILFSNPDSRDTQTAGDKHARRANVTVKLSRDEGKTWPVARAIEPGTSGYSDLAVAPDGTIFCLYERGGTKTHYHTQFLTLARFNMEWLEAGEKVK